MKIGISLSGSAARGIAHLGVLQALEECGIKPYLVAGVSSGAILGALYANGNSPQRILKISSQLRLFSIVKPDFFNSRYGFFSLKGLENLLLKYIPHNSFEELQRPFIVSATDIHTGELIYFSEGELIRPVLASASLPLVFDPVSYQGRTLVDGGVISTMISEPLRQECDFVIGVHTNPFNLNQKIKSRSDLLTRCLKLSVHANARFSFPKFDVVIEPMQLENYGPHRIDKAEKMFEIGYQATMEQKDEILSKLEKTAQRSITTFEL